MTVTGAGPVTEYHRQVKAETAIVSALPYRVTVTWEKSARSAR